MTFMGEYLRFILHEKNPIHIHQTHAHSHYNDWNLSQYNVKSSNHTNTRAHSHSSNGNTQAFKYTTHHRTRANWWGKIDTFFFFLFVWFALTFMQTQINTPSTEEEEKKNDCAKCRKLLNGTNIPAKSKSKQSRKRQIQYSERKKKTFYSYTLLECEANFFFSKKKINQKNTTKKVLLCEFRFWLQKCNFVYASVEVQTKVLACDVQLDVDVKLNRTFIFVFFLLLCVFKKKNICGFLVD